MNRTLIDRLATAFTGTVLLALVLVPLALIVIDSFGNTVHP